jgi:hypothetical protein
VTRPQQTIANMHSWRRGVLAVILLAGLSGSAWASCFGDEWSRGPQMACCSQGHERCPMHDAAASCCAPSVSQTTSQATIVKTASLSAPDIRLLHFAVVSAATKPVPTTPRPFDTSPPAVGVQAPPYIAFSALLI